HALNPFSSDSQSHDCTTRGRHFETARMRDGRIRAHSIWRAHRSATPPHPEKGARDGDPVPPHPEKGARDGDPVPPHPEKGARDGDPVPPHPEKGARDGDPVGTKG